MTDWPVKTLGDLLEVSIGGIWGSEAGEEEVDVFVYRSTELIKDGQLREELTVRRSITARQLDSRKLEEGDLLLEKSGGGPKTPVGRVGLVKVLSGLSVCSNFMQLMRPRKKDVLPVYLHYFLNHFHVAGHTEDLQNNSTNIRNLKTTEYMEVEIPLPPMEEQKRIVALLDAATARVTELTACYEKARTNANNLFASALREALESNPDWPVKTLGQVATFHNGRAYKQQELLDKGKYRVLRVGNFFSSKNWYWSDLELDEHKYCDKGDLLYAWSASFGPRIWDEEKVIYHYHIWKVVEESQQINRQFLKYWLEEDVERVKSASGTGTTMMHVSKGNIEARLISVPPLEKQKRIVVQLDSMRAKTSEMVAAYDAKLTAAQDLRKSILEAAFAGEL